MFKAGEGAGKSGSFFFFSHDRKFTIKTMSKEELDLLLGMLPTMSTHYKNNPDSLIAKIFGAFTVKTDSFSEVHLVLMENCLQLKNPDGDSLKYVFDLKGSMVGRKTKGKITPSTTLKDINFLMATKANPRFIGLSHSDKNKILQILWADLDFLARLNLMDYSLLLGIEKLDC